MCIYGEIYVTVVNINLRNTTVTIINLYLNDPSVRLTFFIYKKIVIIK